MLHSCKCSTAVTPITGLFFGIVHVCNPCMTVLRLMFPLGTLQQRSATPFKLYPLESFRIIVHAKEHTTSSHFTPPILLSGFQNTQQLDDKLHPLSLHGPSNILGSAQSETMLANDRVQFMSVLLAICSMFPIVSFPSHCTCRRSYHTLVIVLHKQLESAAVRVKCWLVGRSVRADFCDHNRYMRKNRSYTRWPPLMVWSLWFTVWYGQNGRPWYRVS